MSIIGSVNVQSVVIIPRVELRMKAFILAARAKALSARVVALDGQELTEKKLSAENIGLVRELHEVIAVSRFVRGLLKEEEVDPQDYGLEAI